MRKRVDLTRLLILLEIADDFEEPAHLYDRLSERFASWKITINPEEIRTSLKELVASGLASAYWLGPGPQLKLDGFPPEDEVQNYYFRITDEGRRIIPVWRDEWPFDDVGDLPETWTPPRA